MSFGAALDEREKRALMALAIAGLTRRTTELSEAPGSDPQANSTVALWLIPMYSPSSASWVPADPSGVWKTSQNISTRTDVSSATYVADRYRAVHTAFVQTGAQKLNVPLLAMGAIGSTFLEAAPMYHWLAVEQSWLHSESLFPTRPPALTSRAAPLRSPSGASPRARVGSEGHGSMAPLADWFKKNRQQFAGKWVALDSKGELVDADVSRAALRRKLLAAGRLRGTVLTQVPDDSE